MALEVKVEGGVNSDRKQYTVVDLGPEWKIISHGRLATATDGTRAFTILCGKRKKKFIDEYLRRSDSQIFQKEESHDSF